MGNTTIEINGKRYNARTGELLGDSSSAPVGPAIKHAARQSRTMDGFVKAPKTQATQTIASASVVTKSVQVKPIPKRASMSDIKHVAAHKPQHSQTLMRKVVKKPSVVKKTPIKTQAPSELAAAPKSAVAVPSHKLAAHNLDEHRLTRARSHAQSKQIARFTAQQQNHPTAAQHRQAAVAQPQKTAQHRVAIQNSQPSITRPVAQRPAPARAPRIQAQPQQGHAHTAADASTIFEAAIANARSHEQPKHKAKRKASHRVAQMASFVAAFVAIAGFVAYLNMPNIELHVASSRAGFHASLPNYKPTGYALDGGVHASNGIVSANFKSGDSSYTVQQQESNWDSQTLLENVVSMASTDHKTYESQGRTVYIYGNNAAWVNGGVLYNMKIDGTLSHQQVVSVATSM